MHRQQLTHVISIERNEVGDLFSFGLGHLESLASLDLEADVSSRRHGNWLTRMKNGGCAAHDAKDLLDRDWNSRQAVRKRIKEVRRGNPPVAGNASIGRCGAYHYPPCSHKNCRSSYHRAPHTT